MKTCTACQRPLTDDTAVCPYCGERLAGVKTLFGMAPLPRIPAGGSLHTSAPDPDNSPTEALPAITLKALEQMGQQQPAATRVPAPTKPFDEDEDEDEDEDGGGATVMIPALRPEDMAELLGAEASTAPDSLKPEADPAITETELMFPIPTASAQGRSEGQKPSRNKEVPWSVATTPASSTRHEDEEEEDEDEEQDQPTMAIPAMNLEALVEASDSAGTTIPSQPSTLATPESRSVRPVVAPQPVVMPSPTPMPPPVAGLESQDLVHPITGVVQPLGASKPSAISPLSSAGVREQEIQPPTASSPPIAAAPAAAALASQQPPRPVAPANRAPGERAPGEAAASRAPANVPPTMAAASASPTRDQTTKPATPAKSKGGGKTILVILGLLLLLAVLGGGAGGAYYFLVLSQVQVECESEVVHQGADNRFQVTLKARQVRGAERPLQIEFQNETKEFSGEGSFSFQIPDQELQVGNNPLQATVRVVGSSKPITTISVDLFLDYRFEVPDHQIKVGQKEFAFKIVTPRDSKLEVENARVEGDGPEKKVLFDLEKGVGPFDQQASSKLKLEFKLTQLLSGDRKLSDTLRIEVLLPQAELRVYQPATLWTAREQLHLTGWIDPSAEVTVNGRDAEMYEEGDFEAKIPLKTGKQQITLEATQEGHVPQRLVINVEKLSRTELRERRKGLTEEAEVWAKEATPPPLQTELLAGAEGDLKGKKFKFEGKVLQLLSAGEETHLIYRFCPDADDECQILITAKGPLDVQKDDPAIIYGILTGKGKFKASPMASERELPAIKADYVIGN